MFSAESFCLFVNRITLERLNMGWWNLVGRCIVKKSRQSSYFKVIDSTLNPHSQKWCWPITMLVGSKHMLCCWMLRFFWERWKIYERWLTYFVVCPEPGMWPIIVPSILAFLVMIGMMAFVICIRHRRQRALYASAVRTAHPVNLQPIAGESFCCGFKRFNSRLFCYCGIFKLAAIQLCTGNYEGLDVECNNVSDWGTWDTCRNTWRKHGSMTWRRILKVFCGDLQVQNKMKRK